MRRVRTSLVGKKTPRIRRITEESGSAEDSGQGATLGGVGESHYNQIMNPPLSHLRRSRTPPPGDTGQEALYLRSLSDRHINVQVQLRDGEIVDGWIEYFDDSMVRITRDGHPNLFIYKHQIRTITEMTRRRLNRSGTAL
jgi:host factor-I protein